MSTILPLPSSPHCRPTTATFLFIQIVRRRRLRAEMAIDGVGNLALIDEPNNLFADLSVFEKQKRGNATDIEAGGGGSIGIDIQLSDLHASLKFRRDRIVCGRQSPARAA